MRKRTAYPGLVHSTTTKEGGDTQHSVRNIHALPCNQKHQLDQKPYHYTSYPHPLFLQTISPLPFAFPLPPPPNTLQRTTLLHRLTRELQVHRYIIRILRYPHRLSPVPFPPSSPTSLFHSIYIHPSSICLIPATRIDWLQHICTPLF